MTASLRNSISNPNYYQQKLEGFKHVSDKQAEEVLDGAISRQAPVSAKFQHITQSDLDSAHDVALALKPEINSASQLGAEIEKAEEYGTAEAVRELELKRKAVDADIEHNYGLAMSARVVRVGHEAVEKMVEVGETARAA